MPVNQAEQAFFQQIIDQQAENPVKPIAELTIEEFRAAATVFNQYRDEPVEISYRDQPMPVRDRYTTQMRIYNDQLTDPGPVLFFYPGCGYNIDLFELNAIACSRIAKALGSKVVIINGRLAPEHPLPTFIYDCYDVTRYMIDHAEQFGIDRDQVFIGGISSGAHCATVISDLAWQDKSLKICHQILLNGLYDLTQSCHDYDEFAQQDILCNQQAINFHIDHFGVAQERFTHPLYSPYFEENMNKLPATTIMVGEYDGLRNHSEAYYKKLKASGCQVNKIVLPGQTHNTLLMRNMMSDGVDPAQVIAEIIQQQIGE